MIFDQKGTVTVQSDGTIDLLSDRDLLGYRFYLIVTLLAKYCVGITTSLGLAHHDRPRRYGQLCNESVERSNQSS